MDDLAGKFDDAVRQKRYRAMAAIARDSFNQQFWNEEAGCLYDVIDDGGRDASIRPNQILAVSLLHTMMARDRANRVVDRIQQDLLTPYGLRTLAPGDAQYRGRYTGGPAERDAAYHQGTVWPWLMGPFITAFVKVHGGSEAARRQAAEWLAPLKQHLSEAGLGHISEIFEGDAPHRPCGCIAQAWSVAEVLRAYVQDVKGIGPVWLRTPLTPEATKSHRNRRC
jgi:glycogen debranching enzyme